MLPIVLAVVGAVAGAALGAASGALGAAALGAAVAVLWNRLSEIGARQASLAREHDRLRERQERLDRELLVLRRDAAPVPDAPPPVTARPAAAAPPVPPQRPPVTDQPAGRAAPIPEPIPEPTSETIPSAARWVVEFFTTGNVVAKVGMVIVFFGVAFLLKYAAERGMVPIEYRLMATAAGAVVLLGVGWRLRHTRRDYAVVLQGGAVGVLYLTIFAAFRLDDLLLASLTFGLLLVVVAFSAVLAVLQSTMSLAVLGTSGGFLAPILASTGGGSHISLFSYYAILDIGVLAIAWFQTWRFLNWIAFVFTCGIAGVWGQQYYQPAMLATTGPFLVFFFLLFIAVAVLFAHRQPPRLRGYIDGSLVFGTPAVAFGMQSVLVRDIPFGRAYSAVAVSALYLVLARALSRRDPAWRPLTDAFLALAVVFLILAVPLAFDGHATAAAWALEGAALVWVGIRQQRRLARLAGAALLLGAGVAFAVMSSPPVNALAVLNTRFLGGVAIATGSVLAGRLLSAAGVSPEGATVLERRLEPALEWVLLVWGLLWWFGTVLAEVAFHHRDGLFISSALLAIAASGLLAGLLARRWAWRALMLATMPIGPLLWIWIGPSFFVGRQTGPLADLGWLAWPVVVGTCYLLMFWFERVWARMVVGIWHAATAWLVVFLVTWGLAAAAARIAPDAPTWSAVLWCAVPAMFVLALRTAGGRLEWPVRRFQSLYAGLIPLAPVAGALAWVLWACGNAGPAAPLAYVPVLNPLELTQALGLIVGYAWWQDVTSRRELDGRSGTIARGLLAAIAFVSLNAVVGRTVHVYLGVAFDLDDLMESSVFQTGVSILWGITAGVLMTLARLWFDRAVWMTGAALIAALIVKLFVIDLGNIGGVARIVSFLATGLLILLIGYLAPVPPRAVQPDAEQPT